jgi:membrane protease YdiL (CAAX protease family)
MHPPSPLAALLASVAGSLGEEILCRLFILSALVWGLPKTWDGRVIALLVSALLFGALHAPACVALFGGLGRVPPLAWCWLIGLNGMLGVTFGIAYLRWGIGAAIVAHFGADLVWHVATQAAS